MLYLCVALLLFLTKCYVFSGNTAVFLIKNSLLEQEILILFQEEIRRRTREAKERRTAVVTNQASAGIRAKRSGRSCKETCRRGEKAPSNSRKVETDFTLSCWVYLA